MIFSSFLHQVSVLDSLMCAGIEFQVFSPVQLKTFPLKSRFSLEIWRSVLFIVPYLLIEDLSANLSCRLSGCKSAPKCCSFQKNNQALVWR